MRAQKADQSGVAQDVGMDEVPADLHQARTRKTQARHSQARRKPASVATAVPQVKPRPQGAAASSRKKDQTERDRRKKGDKAERRPP